MLRVTDEPNIVFKINKLLLSGAISVSTTKIKFFSIMNCFGGMVNQRKALVLISNQDHFNRSSRSRMSNTLLLGFKNVQNLSSGFVVCSCTVVIITTFWHYFLLPPSSSFRTLYWLNNFITVMITWANWIS